MLQLAGMYCDAINEGALPNISNAFTAVIVAECSRALEEGARLYLEGVAAFAPTDTDAPLDVEGLHWHAEAPALRGAETLLVGQARHASPASKVSAAHSTHVSPAPPAKPAAHRQSVSASLAAGEAAFAGHKLHPALPAAGLNVPAAHSAHDSSRTSACAAAKPSQSPFHSPAVIY